jgi:hypothetical protein
MNFSILIPSRGRTQMLLSLMSSIIAKTKDLSQVEFLIKIDDDDVGSGYHSELQNFFGPEVNYRIFVEARSGNICQDYYNYLAKEAIGKIVWAMNDDCIFLGPVYWDEFVLNAVKERGLEGKISYINVGVSGHGDGFSPFPMLSRQAIEALGYFHHPLIKTWDGDVILWNIFNGLKNNEEIDRMVDVREHMTVRHFNGNGQNHDATREHMRVNHMTNGMNAAYFNTCGHYVPEVAKLANAVRNEK